ncbi:MAG: proline--tRNA ligase [Candidatus Thermoplasmatota archaeon]|nr:proline--tRNA ligase [Candidatus Thermoplasmatota archaeon]
MSDDERKIVLDKSEFSDWYNNVVEVAGLSEKRYPVKGMNVWTPYGWKIMQFIDSIIRRECDATGHEEVNFPLLIPKTEFQKEKDHIKGFDAEVYWVTHGGLNELDVPLLLRPTSETAMYPIFSLWVRSHNDLPLKTYQIVNTFRYETKMTRSFIRVREIHFFEAHTCHDSFEDAERQIREDCAIMGRVGKDLCLPYLLIKRPEWDKFAGAVYTIGVDTLMPSMKTLQLGSIHQYRENFSRPYDIKYEGQDAQFHYCHQTTYGMSERLVGAIVGIHGDDKGVILPPNIAPFQFVIIPILAKDRTEMVLEEAKKLLNEMREMGYRVKLDDRDQRPGSKHYDWEIKGVPIRIEIGPRDIEKGTLVFARRDLSTKSFIKRSDLKVEADRALNQVQDELLRRAQEIVEKGVRDVDSLDDGIKLLGSGWDGIIRTHWCGEMDCAGEMEKGLDRTFLGFPMNDAGSGEEEKSPGNCMFCGRPTETVVMLSKSY